MILVSDPYSLWEFLSFEGLVNSWGVNVSLDFATVFCDGETPPEFLSFESLGLLGS